MYHFDKIVSRETPRLPNGEKHGFVCRKDKTRRILNQSPTYLKGFA